MGEVGKPAVTNRVRGTRVRITVSGEFQDEAEVAGDITLWPEKKPVATREVGVTPDRYWDFEFSSPEEAVSFAQEAQFLQETAKKKLNWVDSEGEV